MWNFHQSKAIANIMLYKDGNNRATFPYSQTCLRPCRSSSPLLQLNEVYIRRVLRGSVLSLLPRALIRSAGWSRRTLTENKMCPNLEKRVQRLFFLQQTLQSYGLHNVFLVWRKYNKGNYKPVTHSRPHTVSICARCVFSFSLPL